MQKDKDYKKLQQMIGINFSNIDILKMALTHSSYKNDKKNVLDNQRLEYLGDAVLELVVSEFLFFKFKNKNEGALTKFRSALVNKTHLAKVARQIKLPDFIFLSYAEEKNKGRNKDYILTNTLEALLGAVFVDQGIEKCKKFIKKFILKNMNTIIKHNQFLDPKTVLQEKLQENKQALPSYQVLSSSGPDHSKNFEIGLYINEKLVSRGKGKNKKEAEEKAAEKYLNNYEKNKYKNYK